MNHLSLFSGIGGFDYAADMMGWKNIAHCEINEFGRKILKYYWPDAISYEDITKTDFTIHRGTIDVLSGGFPCQPYSVAGLRKGKEDERHLWPEMLRAIRQIKPRWVVGENVLGLVSWNGGLVFEEVQADLEAEGYEVQPYVLPACGTDAPHKRYRVWFVAYANNERFSQFDVSGISKEKGFGNDKLSNEQSSSTHAAKPGSEGLRRKRDNPVHGFGIASDSEISDKQWNRICTSGTQREARRCSGVSNAPDSYNNGSYGPENGQSLGKGDDGNKTGPIKTKQSERCTVSSSSSTSNTDSFRLRGQIDRSGESEFFNEDGATSYWQNFPTQPPVCNGNDGLPAQLDGITFPKWRNESIKAGGNAIVPQVALQIFKSIEKYEKENGQ